MTVGLVFSTTNMARASDRAHSLSSMVPSLPEDDHSLEPTSAYSSPVSAATSHGNGFSASIGLGISGCNLEPTFNHTGGYANAVPFSMSPALSNHLATPDSLYNMPLKIEDFPSPTYDIYNGLADTSSPLSLYGSQGMGPSSSFNSPGDVGTSQTAFPGQLPGYWASLPCHNPTTPSEISPVSASSTLEGQWNPSYYPEACMGLNVPTLPICSGLPVANSRFSHALVAGESDGSLPEQFSTSARTFINPPSVTSGEETAHISPTSAGKAHASSPGHKPRAKKGYKCPTCDFTFTRRSNCVEHQKKHDPDFKKSFSCDECLKTFGRNADLKRHIDNVSAPHESFDRAATEHGPGPSQNPQIWV